MFKLWVMLLIVGGLAFAQAPDKPPAVEGNPKSTASGLEYWDIVQGTGPEATC